MKPWTKFTILVCTFMVGSCNTADGGLDPALLNPREPALVYLSIEGDNYVLAVHDFEHGTETIYSTEVTIFEFAPSDDGSFIVLAVGNVHDGIDLLRIDREGSRAILLVDCGPDRCSSPALSPSGKRIAFSREVANSNTVSGYDPPRLWTADSTTGDSSELIHDTHLLLGGPSWSPDGRWIAFYDSALDDIRILDLETGAEQFLPSGYGFVGSWSPDGNRIVFPVLIPVDDQFLTSLQVANLITRELEVIIDEENGWEEVGMPSWSPTGEWILIGVQTGEFGVGRQLWRLRPDGSEAQPFLLNPNFVHGGYQWDPTGARIVFQRFPIDDPGGEPEVILWDIDGREKLVAKNAWLPAWLP
jgi:Tol biopolymer transport system component